MHEPARQHHDVASLYAAAEHARLAGNLEVATRNYERILALDPNQPRAMNGLALRALAEGDVPAAVTLLTRASALAPEAAELWLNLAGAFRRMGDTVAASANIDQALIADPYCVPALLQRAELAEQVKDLRLAARSYGAVLNIVGNTAGLPPGLEAALARGRDIVNADREAMAATLSTFIDRPRSNIDDAAARRFDHCVGAVTGKRRIYACAPTGLLYPGLPAIEFFPRSDFPWLEKLEAGVADVQREFAALTADAEEFAPYVDFAPGVPVNQWTYLNRSLAWSAFFFWKDGVRDDANCARCPATAALLESIPMLDLQGRGPAAFFSILRAGARIPPHTGATNIRSVVHLPVVVPPGCALRVGSEIRPWTPGKAMVFDDTIEHEAWNTSDQPRAVLIFDVWNPGLSPVERDLLRALTIGMDVYNSAA